MYREDCGFDAEAEHRKGVNKQKERAVLCDRVRGQNAAVDEINRVPECQDRDEPEESEGRPAEGVLHVLSRGDNGLMVEFMHDKRNRDDGQKLVEHVHRHQVSGKCDTARHTVRHRIKREERVLPPALHVLKGIYDGKGPQEGNQSGKYHAAPVKTEPDFENACEL